MRGFLCEYADEILRRSLQLVEELEAIKKNKKEVIAKAPISLNSTNSLDLELAAALTTYDLSDPF